MARIFSAAGSGTSGTDIRKFTGQEHGGEGFSSVRYASLRDRTARSAFLALAAMQSRAYLAHQTFDPGHGKVDVDRESRAHVFDHLIAFLGLGSSKNWSITAAE